jgi:hypothetical protein
MRLRPATASFRAAKMAAASAVLFVTGSSAFAVTGTIAFQQGINGYTGTANRVIDERLGATEFDGNTVERYFLDGYVGGASPSPDTQGLFRFDNIIGSGAGQIPAGAYILDADFQIMTSFAGNAQTNGPFAVSGLLAPFDNNTSYISFPGGRGPWFQDGTATRPVGRFPGNQPGQVAVTDIRSLVQGWVNSPSTNYGVVVQAGFPGTTDGWGIHGPGHSFPAFRPRLSVTYTTEPIIERTFQRGLNGYSGDTMALLRDATSATDPTDQTLDGLSLTQEFLDGADFNSTDATSFVKFGGVFGAGAGQSPTSTPVAKAWMVLTVGDLSTAAGSPGDWHVHALKKDWNTTSLYSDYDLGFNPEKPTERLGADIGATLDTIQGVNLGTEMWFDVTDYLESVRNGAADYGLAVLAGTPDGIQIHFNGSDLAEARPRLIVASGMLPVVGLDGDYNSDGVVNSADYTVWRDGGSPDSGPAGYALWASNYGATASANGLQSIPEPLGVTLVGAGLAMALGFNRRR